MSERRLLIRILTQTQILLRKTKSMKTNTRILLLCVITACLSLLGVARAETVVWSDNFDDGNGNNRWYADHGVWQIGSPTVGPQTNAAGGRAFSGTNCATTGLTGNYLSSQDSRLIRIASFVVPPSNTYPRLRFWQWYSYAGPYNNGYGNDEGSYGYVEIKAGTNNWQQVSPTYINGGSAVWSRPSIDLTVFAGQTVQVAFHFHSAHNTAVGWYVDDIAVVTDTPVFNNPEGFELGLGDWSTERGTWQVGVPASGPATNSSGGRAHSGTNCAATVLGGNYSSYVDSRLISPIFTVPASNSYPRLRFWQWYSIAGPYNNGYGNDEGSYGYVEIRVGTNGWQTISPQSYNNNSSGVWTCPSIDLTAYAGQTVQVAFHFHSAYNTDVGWYVDDVAVVTGTPVFNNPEGFELGLGDWSTERGTWQVGVPASGSGSAHSGTNCAATVLAGNYASYVDSRLISPPFVVPSSSAALRFWHWYSFAGPYNNGYGNDEGSYGYVEIKTGTNNWQGLLASTNSGASGAWTEPFFDLSSYAGLTVRIAFHTHSAYNVSSGWYVDDVNILNYVTPPLINPYPTNQTVHVQNPVTFAVGASGAGPLYYQWQYNDVPIQGATNTSYFISSAQLANAGNYSVIVSNSSGAVYSPEALLTVLPLPGQLTNIVVNPVNPIGTANYTNGVFTITGSGEDIQGTADAFEFVCQPLTGDGQIVARITSLAGADPAAEAGVMIRESFYAGSTHAFMRVNANTNVVFRRRLATDAYSIDTAYTSTNHAWVRLMRMGNTFVAHSSTNGVNWEYAWFTTVNMSNQVQIGLAVTAHHDGQFATGTFDNVTIGAITPLSGTWPLPGPKFLVGGETGGYPELQRVGGYKFLLGGVVGEYDNIKATSNLASLFANWPSFVTVTNTYGVVPILDPGALTNHMRFYRAQKTGP